MNKHTVNKTISKSIEISKKQKKHLWDNYFNSNTVPDELIEFIVELTIKKYIIRYNYQKEYIKNKSVAYIELVKEEFSDDE
jgi:hypothetical protein